MACSRLGGALGLAPQESEAPPPREGQGEQAVQRRRGAEEEEVRPQGGDRGDEEGRK